VGGLDKRVRIQLAEGFRFVTYPVLTVAYSDREVLAANELALVLESVTNKPQKQTYYPTYNSGYLEYKINANATKVEIARLSFTADEVVSYRNTTLTGAIQVSSIIDGTIENQTTLDVNVVAGNIYAMRANNNTYTPPQLSGATFATTQVAYTNLSINRYSKSIKMYYYYPPEMTFVSRSRWGGSNVSHTVDTGAGLVIIMAHNVYNGF
jgi:hypothetical protein